MITSFDTCKKPQNALFDILLPLPRHQLRLKEKKTYHTIFVPLVNAATPTTMSTTLMTTTS
jgi:hypothetical protein